MVQAIFIAYIGSDVSTTEIKTVLEKANQDSNYTVKVKQCGRENETIFGKIVHSNYTDDRDPYYDDNLLNVGGYDLNKLHQTAQRIVNGRYNPNDNDREQKIFRSAYRDFKEDMFSLMSNQMPFSCAIYDKRSNTFIVGRGENAEEYADLFYGYTKIDNNIMFSNNENVLLQFCNEAIPIDEFTYYKNGEFVQYKTKATAKTTTEKYIKENYANARGILNGINSILEEVTNVKLKQSIEEAFNEYFSSLDPKEKVSGFVSTEIESELKRQLSEIVKSEVDKFEVSVNVEKELLQRFKQVLDTFIESRQLPCINIIKLRDVELGRTKVEFFHERFEQILTQVQLDEPVMLVGPAGSGKNVSISQVSRALGKHMYYTNNVSNEFKLIGFIDAGGTYRDTEFYKAFKNGGVFFLDEIDNSDPSALIVINSALANGYMAFPHETIDRHPDFRIVAAANTWGKGSDLQYVGRNALDGATLDRFDSIFFDYDKKLEQSLYPSDQVLDFMWAFRDGVYASKIPHIVSTRGIGKVYKKELYGVPVEQILATNVIKNLNQDDLNIIVGNMRNLSSNNRYYQQVKSLRIGR